MKNIFSKNKIKYISKKDKLLIFSLLFYFFLAVTIKVYATPPTSPYQAGDTLDPTCAPGDTNCYVEIIASQTGNSGKYLTTDGTTTSWTTVSGGLSNIVDDTTPQLGGNLDLNGNVITGLEIGTNIQAYNSKLSDFVSSNLAITTNTLSASSGAITMTPASGSSLNINLATTGDLVVNTDDLVVDTSTGYVGVGTASPSSKFHSLSTSASDIVGIFQGTTSQTGNLTEWRDVSNNLLLGVDSSGKFTNTSQIWEYKVSGADGYKIDASTGGSGDLRFSYGNGGGWSYNWYSNSTHRVRISDTGLQVGLGNTNGTALLDVAAATTSASSLRIRSGTDPSSPNAGDFWFNGTNLNFYNGSTTTDLLASGGGGVSIGDTVTSSTTGSILFAGATSTLAQDNSNLFWDDTNNWLGIGINTPAQSLDVSGKIALDGTVIAYRPTTLTGTLVLGDGGTSFSHTTGSQAYHNTFVGIGAGNANTTGYDNSALGYQSLYSTTTGYENTAIGFKSLWSNTSGYDNSALGTYALNANTTGYGNSAFGYNTLGSNTSGVYNIALGYRAMGSSLTGSSNTAVGGYDTLRNNTTGYQNVAIGNEALTKNTTGYDNIGIGYTAGKYLNDGGTSNSTGNRSIFIGSDATPLGNAETNQIVIGYTARGNGSNSVTLGNDNITKTILKGSIGIGNTSPSYKLQVGSASVSGIVARFENSSGTCDINPTTTSLSCSSDINLKKNITLLDGEEFVLDINNEINYATNLEKLMSLRVVNFNWNTEVDTANKHIGFIAQQVESVYPDLVSTDANTGLKSLNITNLIPYTISGVQEINLSLDEIKNLVEGSTFVSNLKHWLASVTNGIEEIFTKKLRTEEICVKKSDGTDFCVNGDQLESAINGMSNNTYSSNVVTTDTTNTTDSSNTDTDNTSVPTDPIDTNTPEETPVSPAEEPVITDTENITTDVPTDSVLPEEVALPTEAVE